MSALHDKAEQIRQLRDLRKLKVDRLKAEVGQARKKLDDARDGFAARSLEYEKVLQGSGANFDALLTESEGLEDGQTRMIAVTRTMARQRAAEIRAKTMRDEAEMAIATVETKIEQLMQALAQAQGQLEAAERLVERTSRVVALREEERADDLMQEQYSSEGLGASF